MPYLTLTLDGQLVDLPPDAEVALSFRANDLRTLDSREGPFSEQFTLPLTARNVAVLGVPHALDSQTTAPYRLLPAVLTSPGGTELLRGFAVLDVAGQGYDITLTDALGGLFAQVGDKALRALDLSAYDHTFSFANAQAAQSPTTDTPGYAYALADDGRLLNRGPEAGVLWYELLPAVYYHAVLRAIVAEALPGYRLTGTLLSESAYRTAVLPRVYATPRLRESEREPFAVQVLKQTSQREHDSGSGSYFPLIQFPRQLTGDSANYSSGTEFHTPAYPADIRVSARLLVRLDAEFVTTTVAFVRATVRLVDSTDPVAVAVHEQVVLYTVGAAFTQAANEQPALPRALEFDFTLENHPANRKLAVQLRLENGAGLTIAAGSTVSYAVGPRVWPGAPVQLDASLPDISQADFLKQVVNQFNGLVQADAGSKTVRFDLFNELERRRPLAVDWTDRLDTGTRPALSFRLGDAYGQQNTFAYEDAPNAYDELLLGAPPELAPARGLLPVPNLTLPATAEGYAAPLLLPLPRPSLTGRAGLLWLPMVADSDPQRPAEPYNNTREYTTDAYPVIYGARVWRYLDTAGHSIAGEAPTLDPVGVRVGVVTVQRVAWELLPYEAVNEEVAAVASVVPAPAVPGLRITQDAPGSGSFAPALALSRNGLTWPELLAAFHEGLKRILHRCRAVQVPLRLTPVDIAGLDFATPIKLDIAHVPGYGALRGLFYLNNIDQYQPAGNGPVAVQLVALGDAVPGLAPPVTVPIYIPTSFRALLLENGEPLLLENGDPILLEA